MPRPPRLQVPGGVFHLTTRGNRGQSLFLDDRDRRLYLSLLETVVARYGWRCHAYCLMGNHVHLIVETPEPNLSAGVQYLSGRYAQCFNGRHSLAGHLFQGRYHSVHVKREAQLLTLIRYIALNPVRAGLCTDPRDWRWASYPALMGRTSRPPFLEVRFVLEHFGPDIRRSIAALHAFVFDAPSRAIP